MSEGRTRARWLKANPEKPLKYMRKYYRRNRDALRAKKAAYDAAHPEQTRARQSNFVAKNPNYFREYWHRRKLRVAWLNWSAQCAHSRQSLGDGHV